MSDFLDSRGLGTLVGLTRREILNAIHGSIEIEGHEDLLVILTVSDEEPPDAVDGDYYINTSESVGKLYEYESGWYEVEPSEYVIYLTRDTAELYAYSATDGDFRKITGSNDNFILGMELDGVTGVLKLVKGSEIEIDPTSTGLDPNTGLLKLTMVA